MGGVLNGLATHGGTIPFSATFLTFSDYMRPPIRLAALMGIQVVYVLTHDSLALGEDGPTHQSVEQVAGLTAIPQLMVIRPGDANETAVAWRVAIETRDRPVAMILTRQSVPTLNRSQFASAAGLRRGALHPGRCTAGQAAHNLDRQQIGSRPHRGGATDVTGAQHLCTPRVDALLGIV